jgi:hypothetical protein
MALEARYAGVEYMGSGFAVGTSAVQGKERVARCAREVVRAFRDSGYTSSEP